MNSSFYRKDLGTANAKAIQNADLMVLQGIGEKPMTKGLYARRTDSPLRKYPQGSDPNYQTATKLFNRKKFLEELAKNS